MNAGAQKAIELASHHATLAEVVHHRAATEGDRIAYTFLADGAADARSLTWAQLDQRAARLAATLQAQGAANQQVLLALPSGLAFIESILACWYAGAIAVPVSLPRHQRVKHRLHRIVADAGARFAIGLADTRTRLAGDGTEGAIFNELNWIDPEAIDSAGAAIAPVRGQNVAFLQYTSGSTGMPKGVVVTHANTMHNAAITAEACGHGIDDTLAGWLPLFHDMGLVGMVLQAAFVGCRLVFMSPERFLMRPRQWLAMMSNYGAVSSPAPNFAYDLCVDKIDDAQKAGLDLSKWRNALNGSEPVRAATLERFATAFAPCGFKREAIFPCYGLAEATLFVTGPGADRKIIRRSAEGSVLRDNDAHGHVGCGHTFGGTKLAIVDPMSRRRVAHGAVGEIWVANASVAGGYWNNPEATAATFNAKIDSTDSADRDIAWLRTGDLGFLSGGELYITGRLRELIIIAGRNHFPVDIERTAEAADPAIATSGAVAFAHNVNGVEKLVIAVEIRREFAKSTRNGAAALDQDSITRRVRAAVAAEHEVTPHDVVLLAPGAIPRTTSGKLSHRSAHDAYVNQTLERFAGPAHVNAN